MLKLKKKINIYLQVPVYGTEMSR